ncbi:MAG: hypothetical protein KF730_00645 [Sphingomonas sp.]|uniref:hypothetical protein n=1 Tax=Sphingomonas sp. TaxID=28214 RepID=UPI0025FC6358|nr:hypothetical protein [Sphingomonas sp.]MBX3563059.1 hypothetical protein [Sphingomonas sp.]
MTADFKRGSRAERQYAIWAAPLIALPFSASCAIASPELRSFRCHDGSGFAVTLNGSLARVEAANQVYVLQRRQGSIALRYGSDVVAFAQDGADGFLIGAAGGPYRHCTLQSKMKKSSSGHHHGVSQ